MASCWVVDPEVPSVTVWELADGAYVERVTSGGDDVVTITTPFPVTVCPCDLVR